MKELKLYGKKYSGYLSLVSDEDFDYLSQWVWKAHKYSDGVRAYRDIEREIDGKYTRIFIPLQLSVMESVCGPLAIGYVVDHINGNPLDNRRENLRPATRKQNVRNKRKGAGFTSKYKGVCWRESKKKWIATITVDYKQKALGSHTEEKDAARAYNDAAVKYFGEFACLNVID